MKTRNNEDFQEGRFETGFHAFQMILTGKGAPMMSTFNKRPRKTGNFLTAIIGAFASLFLAGSAFAVESTARIKSVSLKNSEIMSTFTVGDELRIQVELTESLTGFPTSSDVTDYPYITLNLDNLSSEKRIAHADVKRSFAVEGGKILFFTYTIQPGDYAGCLDCEEFFPNAAAVETSSGRIGLGLAESLPTGRSAEALGGAEHKVQTYSFQSTGTTEYSEDLTGKTETEFVVTRNGTSPHASVFAVSYKPNGKNFISVPGSFSIPANAENAVLHVGVLEESAVPIEINLHPLKHSDSAGDLVATLKLGSVPAPSMNLSVNPNLTEVGGGEPVTLTLSKPTAAAKTFDITTDSPDKVKVPKTVTVGANSDSATFQIFPFDGDADITITVSDSNGEYSDGVCTATIENINPHITSSTFGTFDDPKREEDIMKGSEGTPYRIGWTANDVAADKNAQGGNPGLKAIIDWGDGSEPVELENKGASGSATHAYMSAGSFPVTITIMDKDMGTDSVGGLVTIKPGVEVLVHKYEYGGVNSYKGLPGLGKGTVSSGNGAAGFPVDGAPSDLIFKFSPLNSAATLVAHPETCPVDGQNYESFFHVWVGGLANENSGLGFSSKVSLQPVAPSSCQVKVSKGNDNSVEVGAVFSREFLPGDGCGDVDQDGLPDKWEMMYGGTNNWETPDRMGNRDGDFLPRGVNPQPVEGETIQIPYPLPDYSPSGIAFGEVYEVRGFNLGLNKKGGSPSAPQDEPRFGTYDGTTFAFTEADNREFFGTDPTKADTDGDGLTDGWEYYFWYVASFSTNNITGERWDPTKVTEGIEISREEIIAGFNPLVPGQAGQNGSSYSDFDGDGLSDYEEMLLGTNPIHWDTDGDGMNDGWEVMWGLDPFADDSKLNPDGDCMALRDQEVEKEEIVQNDDGTSTTNIVKVTERLRHCDVRIADIAIRPENKGYDPRVAWAMKVATSRDQTKLLDAPDTAEFSNYEEHYLGRWCLDHGLTTEVPPLSRTFMTQPTPKGAYRYATTNSPLHSATAIGGTSTNRLDTGATVAGVGILQVGIETHGYDSDGDGMPDGWELYCFDPDLVAETAPQADFYRGNIWPTSDVGDSASDASEDSDGDQLTNLRECHGSALVAYYQTIDPELVNVNAEWENKFWPTNPWNGDTDLDMLSDAEEEQLFNYSTAENGGQGNPDISKTLPHGFIRGGGLNPCTVDTDHDFLPDPWEASFAGTGGWEGDAVVWDGGMDGTWFDAMLDYDHDGLWNYQEYWVAAMPNLQYDAWNGAIPDGSADPRMFFVDGENGGIADWDWNINAAPGVPYCYIPKQVKIANRSATGYASTNPSKADTDDDGMDDYYEMFHCLNPILSEAVDVIAPLTDTPLDVGALAPADFKFWEAPWLAGLAKADPDQDGIPNFEEALTPKQSAPQPAHTDPSPLWMTDMSSKDSLVNRFYGLGSVPMFWDGQFGAEAPTQPLMDTDLGDETAMKIVRPSYMYDFEMNEGFDTDNDSRSDRSELIPKADGFSTDPLDVDSPGSHKVLYLDGQSAARTIDGSRFGPHAFHSWTIQMWIKPESVTSAERRILIERPVYWKQEDVAPAFEEVRRTFRVGLETDGRPFVEFDNGGTDAMTDRAIAGKSCIATTNWTHIAATMDGVHKCLSLYVNGKVESTKSTQSIPYTGFFGGNTNVPSLWAPIVIGAADLNPFGRVDGSKEFFHAGTNYPSDWPSVQKVWKNMDQPNLTLFFKGWIDDVSIWTGARTHEEIVADYETLKRYRLNDVIEMRENAANAMIKMLRKRGTSIQLDNPTFDQFYVDAQQRIIETGGETEDCYIPPTMYAHYNFDSLADPRMNAPENEFDTEFNSLRGRPAGYTEIPFWAKAANCSKAYTSYTRLPLIKNLVSQAPMGHLRSVAPEKGQTNVNANAGVYFDADSSADSVYWTRYEEGGVPNGTGEINSFPNSANPYGIGYQHGTSYESQRSIRAIDEIYDPDRATLFNDLLPLNNAFADGMVMPWDDSFGTDAGKKRDTDGDGLPDEWELANGMDPFNADENHNGIPDFFDDFDGDGMSNGAEMKAGTDPRDITSNPNGHGDYYDNNNGFLFSDNDYVDDQWEIRWDDRCCSPDRYDEYLDEDNDGWDNWSERHTKSNPDRAEGFTRPDDPNEVPVPTLIVSLDYDGSFGDVNFGKSDAEGTDKPAKDVKPAKGNKGDDKGGNGANLVVHVYSDQYMNGRPDAIYVKPITKPENWPMSVVLTAKDLAFGHVRQGRNWFYAFVDLDNSSVPNTGAGSQCLTWTPGEAAGIADGQWPNGIDIGYDVNKLRIPLSENSRNYARLSWTDKPPVYTEDGKEGHDVLIRDTKGNNVFHRYIEWPRTSLHEGDIMAGRSHDLGLSADIDTLVGNQYCAEFEWVLDEVPMGFFTNYYDMIPVKPVLIRPRSTEVVFSAMVDFEFRLPRDATEFIFTLSRSGSKIFEGRFQAPGRTYYSQSEHDLVKWRFPYSVGSTLPGGKVFSAGLQEYTWKVASITPKKETHGGEIVSDESKFTLATGNTTMGGGNRGSVVVNVSYPSAARTACANGKTPVMRVQAFRNAAFSGRPEAEVEIKLTSPVAKRLMNEGMNVTLRGLQPVNTADESLSEGETLPLGYYYVRAFVDQHVDYNRQSWESWGYYRDYANKAEPYRPVPVKATALNNTQPGRVEIRDADTDNDKLPDSWEAASAGTVDGQGKFLTKLGYSSRGSISTTGSNQKFGPYGDADGDGVNDFDECYITGTNPTTVDSDGDGISDGVAHQLGFVNPMSLSISSIDVENGGLSLAWDWNQANKRSSVLAAPHGSVSTPSKLGAAVRYVVEWTSDLNDPDSWKELTTTTESNSSSIDVDSIELTPEMKEAKSLFFRVRLLEK